MKSALAAAVAVVFTVASAAAPALAERPAAQFRSVAPQPFSAGELQQYGLDRAAADRAVALQQQGYEIKVLSTEEAAQYQAGITDNQWLLIGILVGVVVIAVAVGD